MTGLQWTQIMRHEDHDTVISNNTEWGWAWYHELLMPRSELSAQTESWDK